MGKKNKNNNQGNNGTPTPSGDDAATPTPSGDDAATPTPSASRLPAPAPAPGAPLVHPLTPEAMLTLGKLMAEKDTFKARVATVESKRESLTLQRTILDQQAKLLDAESANIDRAWKDNTASRLAFLAAQGIDLSKYSPNLVNGQMVLTEKK